VIATLRPIKEEESAIGRMLGWGRKRVNEKWGTGYKPKHGLRGVGNSQLTARNASVRVI